MPDIPRAKTYDDISKHILPSWMVLHNIYTLPSFCHKINSIMETSEAVYSFYFIPALTLMWSVLYVELMHLPICQNSHNLVYFDWANNIWKIF